MNADGAREVASGSVQDGPVPPATSTPATSWLPAWTGLVLLWGCSFLFMSLALRVFSPMQVAFGRVLLGGLLLYVVVAATRQRLRWPVRRVRRDIVIVALTLSALPFACIAVAQTRITTVLAGLLNAVTPLWAALFLVLLLPSERPTRWQFAGLVTGVVGLGVLLGAWDVGSVDLLGAALLLVATASYGFSTVWTRSHLGGPDAPRGALLPALQLAASTALLLPLVPVGGAPDTSADLTVAVLAMLGVGFGGTGVAYLLFFRLVRTAGATVAATTTYGVPLVSTTLGALVLHEPVSWNQPVGGVVVLAGVAMAQRRG